MLTNIFINKIERDVWYINYNNFVNDSIADSKDDDEYFHSIMVNKDRYKEKRYFIIKTRHLITKKSKSYNRHNIKKGVV